jgi:hypothetical protein
MNANSTFELSRIFAHGWNAAKRLPMSASDDLSSVDIEKLNPHQVDIERLRWSEGFAQALREGPSAAKRFRISTSHKWAQPE